MAEATAPDIRHLEQSLLELDNVPQFGGSPDFPWQQLLQGFSATFGLDGLGVHASDPEWLTVKRYHSQVASTAHPIDVRVSGIEGKVHFLMAESDWKDVTGWLVHRDTSRMRWSDDAVREGFIRFTAAEALHQLVQTGYLGDLVPRLAKHDAPADEPALMVEMQISFNKAKVSARVIFPASFHAAWLRKVGKKRPTTIDPEVAAKTDLDLRLIVGQTKIGQEDWKRIQEGDLLLLDQCSWPADSDKGQLTVFVEDKPIFRAEAQANQAITITDILSVQQSGAE